MFLITSNLVITECTLLVPLQKMTLHTKEIKQKKDAKEDLKDDVDEKHKILASSILEVKLTANILNNFFQQKM